MQLIVLDKNFQSTIVIDTFDSLIWSERYSAAGDFELYTPFDSYLVDEVLFDYYMYLSGSDKVMIVENFTIDNDVESGAHCKISGRSLESILDRRVLLDEPLHEGSLQTLIQDLLNTNIINPTDTKRKITNFEFEASTDPIVTAVTVNIQLKYGDNLYDVISSLCEQFGIGFKVTLTETNTFKFKLYSGVDRSYSQLTNPYVIFSPNFESLSNSSHIRSNETMKTLAIVDGSLEVSNSVVEGLDRREITVNPASTGLGNLELEQEGYQALFENGFINYVEGEVKTQEYGVRFFMGDIVELENDYGIASRARVTELIRSQSQEGITTIPKFTNIL